MRTTRSLGILSIALALAAGLLHQTPVRAGTDSAAARGVIFAALNNGYLYRNNGNGWQEADNGLPTGTDITAITVAVDGHTVYAGTRGAGVYLSTDSGNNWQDDNAGNGDLQSSTIVGFGIDAGHGQGVYAVTADDWLFYSPNYGYDWSPSALPTSDTITAFAMDAQRPSTMLVGTDTAGIFRSTDAGANWYSVSDASFGTVNGMAFNPRSSDVAFAATANGMYQTIDGGASWQADQRGIAEGLAFQSVAVDPKTGSRVVAGTSDGALYRSIDGGTTWSRTGGAGGRPITALLFDPTSPTVVFGGTSDGDVSLNGYDNGRIWYYNSTPFGADNGVLALAGNGRPASPVDAVPPPYGNPTGVRYFSETHHTVRGQFLRFYNAYGNLKIFGLPLTEAFAEGGQTVQYFERARLAYVHGRIVVGALGSQVSAGRYFYTVGCCGTPGSSLWFRQTGHSLSGNFLSFWKSHHGSLLFGLPISQPLYERNGDGTGRTYLVQYFQNARMEYHPELGGTRNVVTLGLLGQQVLHNRGWL